MPLIDTPFKRVAVDIVGLIVPPNEAGHQYMLTIGDYANRYLEAVPLKKINTKAIAEALFDIFSRVDIPEEVSTDQVTQFLSADQVTQYFVQMHAGSIQTAQYKLSPQYAKTIRFVTNWV